MWQRIAIERAEFGDDIKKIQCFRNLIDKDVGIGPLSLHHTVFIPTLEILGNEEQRNLYLQAARRLEIIGCYAQTELGHGSNV